MANPTNVQEFFGGTFEGKLTEMEKIEAKNKATLPAYFVFITKPYQRELKKLQGRAWRRANRLAQVPAHITQASIEAAIVKRARKAEKRQRDNIRCLANNPCLRTAGEESMRVLAA